LAIKATLKARRRRRRILWMSVMVGVVAVLLAIYAIAAATNSSPNDVLIGKPVSSSVLQQVTGVQDSTLLAIGQPSAVSAPVKLSGGSLTSGGKPEVFYYGGEFCPYCAMERWAIMVALSHFGNFTGLEYMLSSGTDVYANTPTFTFRNATYTSSYIAFVAVEKFGRGGLTDVVQPLTAGQQSLVTQYDTCAATGGNGGIPFIDVANAYAVNCGAQYTLDVSGQNWTQVSSQLDSPNSNVAKLIDGGANTLISAICKVDGAKPSSVCTQSYATLPLAYASAGPPVSHSSLMLASASRAEA
jgi:Domain of unknown function (DUF929)